jgi:hypothetical protein
MESQEFAPSIMEKKLPHTTLKAKKKLKGEHRSTLKQHKSSLRA